MWPCSNCKDLKGLFFCSIAKSCCSRLGSVRFPRISKRKPPIFPASQPKLPWRNNQYNTLADLASDQPGSILCIMRLCQKMPSMPQGVNLRVHWFIIMFRFSHSNGNLVYTSFSNWNHMAKWQLAAARFVQPNLQLSITSLNLNSWVCLKTGYPMMTWPPNFNKIM